MGLNFSLLPGGKTNHFNCLTAAVSKQMISIIFSTCSFTSKPFDKSPWMYRCVIATHTNGLTC